VGQGSRQKGAGGAVYNHYKRIVAGNTLYDGVEVQKSNILLIGPPACGKTQLAPT
jgi:ATP-dependent Clp protease ATP-binding subunit ClpX